MRRPDRTLPALQRQLAECKAGRDAELEWEIATAEVLQIINPHPATSPRCSKGDYRYELRQCCHLRRGPHRHRCPSWRPICLWRISPDMTTSARSARANRALLWRRALSRVEASAPSPWPGSAQPSPSPCPSESNRGTLRAFWRSGHPPSHRQEGSAPST
jgi:hypothetical protein